MFIRYGNFCHLSYYALAVALLFFSGPLLAANLFVTPSGAGVTCEVSNPCATIQTAVDAAASGDHIYIGPGTYTENVEIPIDKTDLRLTGTRTDQVLLVSAGADLKPKFTTPFMFATDIVLDIFGSGTIVEKLSIIHPAGETNKRDIGIFIRPPAHGVVIQSTLVERRRDAGDLEPTEIGSRGILVFQADGAHIVNNTFTGNYQDHIHLPTKHSVVSKNTVLNATRLGIVVIQENADSDNSNNHISKNEVSNSGSDGIQIQGDHNFVQANTIRHSVTAAIRLCGLNTSACVAPGASASADNNTVAGNMLEENGSDVIDGGIENHMVP